MQSPSAGPFFIVLNAGSGHDDAAATRQTIEGVLSEAGREHRLLLAESGAAVPQVAQDALAQAKEAGGTVVAAGGDGTINAVVQTVLGSGVDLGVLPQGTFNYFGRAHGLALDTAEATRALLVATPQPVQVGLVNGHVFLVNASVGLYPQILEDREAWKQRFGRSRLVALGAALATLVSSHRPLRLRMDGSAGTRDVRTPTLFVGNNPLQLEQIGIPLVEALHEGELAAITLRPVSTFAMLGLALRGALGRLGDADDVSSFGFEHLSVSPARPRGAGRMKVATDGEVVFMQPPLEFSVAPQPLMLLKPPAAAAAGGSAEKAAA